MAAQDKLDVARFLEMSPLMLRQGPERVIDKSLLVAKIINGRWPIHELSGPFIQDAQLTACLPDDS
ncbi:hypothetical protein AO069_03495 [Pseudomonas syringae pv. syringae PD2774]|nr:hypothetical protein AO069_03495 [Pseudomonas syringae pv. syringae PD2774]KWS23047.1 hypothetical protein AL061_22675 [Pseudomonas syringae pv. syringae]